MIMQKIQLSTWLPWGTLEGPQEVPWWGGQESRQEVRDPLREADGAASTHTVFRLTSS